MMSCLLRELPQGKTQTIHPQTRAVIQRGFRPCSKIWKCICTPSDTDTNLGHFSPKPNSVLPMLPAEVVQEPQQAKQEPTPGVVKQHFHLHFRQLPAQPMFS